MARRPASGPLRPRVLPSSPPATTGTATTTATNTIWTLVVTAESPRYIGWDTGAATRLTIIKPGYYFIWAKAAAANVGPGDDIRLDVYLNGSAIATGGAVSTSDDGNAVEVFYGPARLVPGQYLEIRNTTVAGTPQINAGTGTWSAFFIPTRSDPG